MNATPMILVTRPDGERDPLAAALRAEGYDVAAVPLVATRPVAPGGPLDAAARTLDMWDWIVITSREGVRAIAEAAARVGHPLPAGSAGDDGSGGAEPGPHWAAVGPATAAALASIGIRPDLVPAEATGFGIARALADAGDMSDAQILLPRADAASPDLPAALRAVGAVVEEVVAYHTIEGPPEAAADLSEVLRPPGPAAIVVASGSAVRGLVALAGTGPATSRIHAIPIVAIGPSTAAVARSLGFERVSQAAEPTVPALVAAVRLAVQHQPDPEAAPQRESQPAEVSS